MSLNDLRKRQLSGMYLDLEVLPAQKELSEIEGTIDRIDGIEPSQIDYDCTILECHVDLDLEGYEDVDEDGEPTGIRVPYIVTMSLDNGQVLSIRRNYQEDDELKKKISYFTHYKFLPGFGFYGLGLIHTIGGFVPNRHGGTATVDRRGYVVQPPCWLQGPWTSYSRR